MVDQLAIDMITDMTKKIDKFNSLKAHEQVAWVQHNPMEAVKLLWFFVGFHCHKEVGNGKVS